MARPVNVSKWRRAIFVATLLVSVIGGACAVYRLPAPIVDRMIRSDIERVALIWQDLVLELMAQNGSKFGAADVTAAELGYLELIPAASDIYRFKLFDRDGRIFYSSRASDTGTVTSEAYFFETVALGRTFYKTERKPPSEIDDFSLHQGQTTGDDRHVVEIYTPIVANGGFDGAIEFYTDVTDTRASYISRIRMILVIASIFATTVVVVVAVAIARVSEVRLRAMTARAEAERRLMSEQVKLSTEIRLLSELNEWLQSARSLDELFEMVGSFLSHMLPTCEGSLYVYSNSRDVLEGSAKWNGGMLRPQIRPEQCWALRRGRTYSYGYADVEFACDHVDADDGRSYACFPILAHGETIGLLHMRARVAQKFETFAEIRDIAQTCAEQISMAIANVRMRDQLQDQSIRDPLTGLFNRRHLLDRLRAFVDRSVNGGASLSVISVDVDHFKKFNDNHGHDAGDMVLRAVGTVLAQSVNGSEIACRNGGEEFMLLLPDASNDEAIERGELVRTAVEDIRVRYGDKSLPRITISLGVAHFPVHGRNAQDLIRASDDALYKAKARGRNVVVVARSHADEAAEARSDDAFAGVASADAAAAGVAETDALTGDPKDAPKKDPANGAAAAPDAAGPMLGPDPDARTQGDALCSETAAAAAPAARATTLPLPDRADATGSTAAGRSRKAG